MAFEVPTNQAAERRRAEDARVRSREEYVDFARTYALGSGWVKEEDIPAYEEKLYDPIYREYLEIVYLLNEETAPPEEIQDAMIRLNACLASTQRAGTTDKNNILQGLADARARAQRRSDVAAGAVGNFYETVAGIFDQLP